MVTVEDVIAARRAIEGRVHRTPLVHSTSLTARIGAPVYLKLECWQKTGSFKPRGVLTKIASLSQTQREKGLVTALAGNHAQAVSWAATSESLACTVVMPRTAPAAKLAATQDYGGTVLFEPSVLTLFSRVESLVSEQGYTFIPPFDDPAIIAGQGTVGLEIVEDLPEVGTVVVPIGGGGLIAGIAVAIKSSRPGARVVGVEQEGAAAMWHSRQAGQPIRLDRVQTIADGLAAPFAGVLPFTLVERYVDELVLVSDVEIRTAMGFILERCKVLAEPAGAVALAALLTGTIRVRPQEPVVVIVSGGNVDLTSLSQLLMPSQ